MINISGAKKLIVKTLQAGLVPFIQSSPGIGKSDIVKQIAEEHKLKLIDIRLSQMEPNEILGFPLLKGDKFTFNPMDTFPLEGDKVPEGYKGWIVFLDEFNSAPLSVQAASYRLVLDREIGQYNLHPKVAIVCAGNLATDKAITNRLSTAMQSRLIHLEIQPDLESWLDWAKNKIDYRIRAFLEFRKELLHKFDPNHSDYTFPTPRTWHFLSKIISKEETLDKELVPLIWGTVGKGAGNEFYGYTQIFKDLPKYEDILDNPKKVPVPDESSTLYAISYLLGSSCKNESEFNSMIKFVERMPIEFQVITLKNINSNIDIHSFNSFDAWTEKHASQLL